MLATQGFLFFFSKTEAGGTSKMQVLTREDEFLLHDVDVSAGRPD